GCALQTNVAGWPASSPRYQTSRSSCGSLRCKLRRWPGCPQRWPGGCSSHALRVAQEMFEAVVFPEFGMKNVNHHVAVIHHHPPARRVTVVMRRANAFVLEPTRDFIRNRLQVRLGRAGANEKIVRERRDLAHVED